MIGCVLANAQFGLFDFEKYVPNIFFALLITQPCIVYCAEIWQVSALWASHKSVGWSIRIHYKRKCKQDDERKKNKLQTYVTASVTAHNGF